MSATKTTADKNPAQTGTADQTEIDRFAAIADEWWDPNGKFRPLHQFNPARVSFIRDHVSLHFDRDANAVEPFQGLDILDIGCGGGILAEPMTRLGGQVTAIDAAEKSIGVARHHAEEVGLDIDYRVILPEELSSLGRQFDVVLNMEVVEHVADVDQFLQASADLVKPGGCMVFATLNRTLKSLAMAKVGAEYILRWLPVGTHDWNKFVKPSELARGLRPAGLSMQAVKGMVFNPLNGQWSIGTDTSVNYLAFFTK